MLAVPYHSNYGNFGKTPCAYGTIVGRNPFVFRKTFGLYLNRTISYRCTNVGTSAQFDSDFPVWYGTNAAMTSTLPKFY